MGKIDLYQPVTDEEIGSCCSVFREKNKLGERNKIKAEIKFYVARILPT